MKPNHLLATLLLLTGSASAQLKTGSNPESIAATSNFEVEATNGSKTVIEKTTGNLGIGTTTPATALTVNGGIATNYTSVTANAYTLAAADSIVAWSGTAAGTLTLPAAVSGTGNFKGRTYTVKNTSGSYAVAVAAPSSETIDANSSYSISPGASASFVSTGATSGATWTAVGQSSSAVTTFSGGFVSGVDLSGLPTATINVTLVANTTVTVSTSQVTTAMNSLPSSGGVIIVKPTNAVTFTSSGHGTPILNIGAPTNVSGRKFYLLIDFSSSDLVVSGSYQHPINVVTSSRAFSPEVMVANAGLSFAMINTQGGTIPFTIKHSPILSFTGTTSDYWLVDEVGSVSY